MIKKAGGYAPPALIAAYADRSRHHRRFRFRPAFSCSMRVSSTPMRSVSFISRPAVLLIAWTAAKTLETCASGRSIRTRITNRIADAVRTSSRPFCNFWRPRSRRNLPGFSQPSRDYSHRIFRHKTTALSYFLLPSNAVRHFVPFRVAIGGDDAIE